MKEGYILIDVKKALTLYLITDNNALNGRDFFECVESALKGGVTMVQLREKNITSREFYLKALKLKEMTSYYNIPLIINDRLDIALAVNADGVHVGQNDIPVKVVRNIVNKDFIVGATAPSKELALNAEVEGADYIGAGAVFTTKTKSDTKSLSKIELNKICTSIKIPVTAIGGICLKNISELKNTGICGAAVSSGIMGAYDIEQECIKLKKELA